MKSIDFDRAFQATMGAESPPGKIKRFKPPPGKIPEYAPAPGNKDILIVK